MSRPPLVMTQSIAGSDGISRLSREVVSALSSIGGGQTIEVWSWAERGGSGNGHPASARVRFAAERYDRVARWTLAELPRRQRGRAVFVLHAHLAPLAIPLMARGAALVQFLLGIEVFRKLRPLEARALRRATRLLSISNHTVSEFLSRNESFRGSEPIVCHPGVSFETNGFPTSDADGFALVVGRMAASERYKGHDLLLEVWPRLLERVATARLVIVGDGDDRPRLESKAAALGLQDRVHFEGRVDDGRLVELYAGCRFFVMPSAMEGFGIVFLEAMGHAKACIAGEGAPAEIVVDGETGFVIPPEDGDALTESLLCLFESDDLVVEMGRRGRERFERHFTDEQFRLRLESALAGTGLLVG